jgi:putative MATE family efflux protein
MEVRGAGIAFAVSHYIGTLLFFLVLFRKPALAPALQWRYLKFNGEWARRILKIGIPSSIQNFIRVASMMAFGGMLARTPDKAAALAALQIGMRTEGVAFMPGFGYSMAAGALTGQNLGAKRPERAERYALAATGQAMLVMAIMACLFFVFAHPITKIFSQDLLVQKLGVEYLQINAICEPFLALGMVLMGALQGAGDTIRPTIIVFVTMIALRLPLAHHLIFTRGWGAYGAWWALVITTFVSGCLTFAWFRLGHWKKTKV